MKAVSFGILLASPIWIAVAFIPPLGWWTVVQLLAPPLLGWGLFKVTEIAVNRGFVK
jgi:hypothetical protein